MPQLFPMNWIFISFLMMILFMFLLSNIFFF